LSILYGNDRTGAAAAQEEEQSPASQKVGGSIPSFPGPHIEVSVGKILNPTLPTDVWECVGESPCITLLFLLCTLDVSSLTHLDLRGLHPIMIQRKTIYRAACFRQINNHLETCDDTTIAVTIRFTVDI